MLKEQIDWRLRLIHYGLEYLHTEQGQANAERIQGDIGMAVVELLGIVEG